MSHFSVFVTVPQSEHSHPIDITNLEGHVSSILAPYDEQTEEAEFCEFNDRTEDARSSYETDTMRAVRFPDGSIHSLDDQAIRDRFILVEDTFYEYGPNHSFKEKLVTDDSKALELIPEYPAKLMYPDFDAYCEDYCGYVKSADGRWGYTCNPNAKWDWWQIGGRFPGGLLVKNDLKDCILSCKENQADAPAGYKYADAARKKDICWELMKKIAMKIAEQNYQRYIKAFEAKDAKDIDFFARVTEDGISGWCNMIYIKGETLDEYKARKGTSDTDQYQVHAYAFVDRNGDWNASGDMGWFGISCNDKPERAWNDELQTLMNEVQDDDFIVAVDCHI